MPMFLGSMAEAILMINTQNDPASQACWGGEHEGYRNVKGQSVLKKKKKNQSCIYMMNQNPLLGFVANPKSPELVTLIQGWPLPLF